MTEQRTLTPSAYNAVIERHKQDLVDLLNRAALDGVSFELTAAPPPEKPLAKKNEDGTVADHVRHCAVYSVPVIIDQPLGLHTAGITVNIDVARTLKPTGDKSFIVESQEIVVAPNLPHLPNIKITSFVGENLIEEIDNFPGLRNSIDWRHK